MAGEIHLDSLGRRIITVDGKRFLGEACCCEVTPPSNCAYCTDVTCVSLSVSGVTLCPQIDGYFSASGTANGTFDLPSCGGGCFFAKSFCDQISYFVGGPLFPYTTAYERDSYLNWTCSVGAAGVAVVLVFPSDVVSGDEFSVTLQAPQGFGYDPLSTETISFTATASTAANVTAGLTAAINSVSGGSYFETVEAVDGYPTAAEPCVFIRPRTRELRNVTVDAESGSGPGHEPGIEAVNAAHPMTLVTIRAYASHQRQECCDGGRCSTETLATRLPVFHANALFSCCPTGTITLTNGTIALGAMQYPDGTFSNFLGPNKITDGTNLFYNCDDEPGTNYTGDAEVNFYLDVLYPCTEEPIPAPVRAAHLAMGGAATLTMHHTGDECPDEFLCPTPPPCIEVEIDQDVSVFDTDCDFSFPFPHIVASFTGSIGGSYTLTKNPGFECGYALCVPDMVTGDFYTCDHRGKLYAFTLTFNLFLYALRNNGIWHAGFFTGSNVVAEGSFTDCDMSGPLRFLDQEGTPTGGSVGITVPEPGSECPPHVGQCEIPSCQGDDQNIYYRARVCGGGDITTLYMLASSAAAIGALKYLGVCYSFDSIAVCHPGEGGTVIEPDDGEIFDSCDECGASGGDECSEPCLSCDDCPEYCPDDDKTSLSLTIEIAGGECGICECNPGTGDGAGSCDNCDPTCSGCGHICTGPGCPECIHFAICNAEDCIAAGHDWYCDPEADDETAVFSPCSWVNYSGSLNLPLTGHTSTTMTFSDTVNLGVYGDMDITVTFNCAAKTYYFLIIIDGNSSTNRCRMEYTVPAGGSVTCEGITFGFGIPMTDQIIETTCTGNGAHISNVTIHRAGCEEEE